MKLRHRALAVLRSVTLLLLVGCERGSEPGARDEMPERQRYGGTAVVAGIVDLQSMNALVANEANARAFQRDVLFMPLLRYDAELQPQPWLAERWDTARVGPDSLELTFHLRPDAPWHDGRPTTAQDVSFTFQRVRDPRVGSSLAGAFSLYAPTATVVDPRTFRVRLRAHAEFLDGWTQLPIMPSHVLGDVPTEQLATHPFGTSTPVGNGPFRFVQRTAGQEWVFEANPRFPRELGGRPYLDRLVYRAIPDQTTLLTELLTGGVDVYLALRPEQVERAEADPSVSVLTSPSRAWTYVAWNSKLPMFDTPEERRALSMAINREELAGVVLGRYGKAGRSVVTPAHWAFEDDPGVGLPYSVEAARRLLAQVGWHDRNGDGILEDAAGHPFRFTLKTPAGNRAREDAVQMLQAQLRRIGVDARPSLLEGNTLISQLEGRVNAGGERERDFEAVVMVWIDDFRKDDSNLFHTRSLNGPFQITSFSDPRVDELLDTLPLIVDRAQARPLWREYQRIVAEKAPKTVLYYPNRTVGVRKRLRGVEMDWRGDLISVARWWIAPQERGAAAPQP